MSETGPPQSPEPDETGEFAEFFHTEDLPAPVVGEGRPTSHRGETPLVSRVLAPLTAVVVVVVVIVLLIIINGHNPGHGTSPAAVAVPTTSTSTAPSPQGSRPVARPSSHSATSPTAATSPSAKPSATPTHKANPALTAMAPVQVLNNSRRTGLAKAVAGEIDAKGWRVLYTGNRQGITPVSTLYYSPGDKAAAQHLAHEFRGIRRVSPNKAGALEFKGLTLVLTAAWVG